jgi:glycosyltransferase involved in cell wall biosynthesis
MSTISVCVITKNEAHNIVACLNSVAWADEIIILDAESTDNTVELCKQFTNKISVAPWPGCGPQRKAIFDQATCDWVLFLDADERITPKLAEEIQATIRNPKCTGYEIPFQSYYCGKRIRFGDWMNEKHIRLFKRSATKIIPRLVHFGLDIQGKIGRLHGHIVHYSFPNVTTVINKMHSYSTYGAEHFFQAGKRTTFGSAVRHGLFAFIRGYILRFGFLDGRQGLMLAISIAEGAYYKYLKLLDLQQGANQPVVVANTDQPRAA